MSCFHWLVCWNDLMLLVLRDVGRAWLESLLWQVGVQILATSPIGKGSGSKQKMYHCCFLNNLPLTCQQSFPWGAARGVNILSSDRVPKKKHAVQLDGCFLFCEGDMFVHT